MWACSYSGDSISQWFSYITNSVQTEISNKMSTTHRSKRKPASRTYSAKESITRKYHRQVQNQSKTVILQTRIILYHLTITKK